MTAVLFAALLHASWNAIVKSGTDKFLETIFVACGAALVSAADIAVRLIAPDGQLLLGVLTAMIGAPFFIWLIIRMRREP